MKSFSYPVSGRRNHGGHSLFALLVLSLVVFIGDANATMTAEFIEANGLNFTCTVYKSPTEDDDIDVQVGRKSDSPETDLTFQNNNKKKNIIMLHGFPMSKEWWHPLIEHWDTMVLNDTGSDNTTTSNIHAVACDLRGYSPGASPDDISEYDYSIFAEDVWAIADALSMDKFDLLGHDHGAGLAWYMAGNDDGDSSPTGPRINSLTTFSVPHIDLLSGALCGDNADEDQVIALNYFNQFALPDSASINNSSLTVTFNSFGLGVEEPIQFQKMLWWYIGSVGTHFAQPGVVSDAEVVDYAARFGPQMSFFIEVVRQAVPIEERPCEEPSNGPIGAVEVPTLFVCGTNDFTLLCSNPYATDIPDGLLPNYEHVNFDCEHDFFLEGNCNSIDESRAVMEKVASFLFSTTAEEDGMVDDNFSGGESDELDSTHEGTGSDGGPSSAAGSSSFRWYSMLAFLSIPSMM